MFAPNIELQAKGNSSISIRESTGAIWLSSNQVNRDGELDSLGKIGQEQESAGGDSYNEGRVKSCLEIMGNLKSDLGNSVHDLVLGPKDPLYMRV